MNNNPPKLVKELNDICLEVLQITTSVNKILWDASNCATYLGDIGGGFFGKIGAAAEATSIRRKRADIAKRVNGSKSMAYGTINAYRHTLDQANEILKERNINPVTFNLEINNNPYSINNAANNDNWYDTISHYVDQIVDSFNEFSTACEKAANLLEQSEARPAAEKA